MHMHAACIFSLSHTLLHICTHSYTHIYVHIHIHTNTYDIYIHAHTLISTHTLTYTETSCANIYSHIDMYTVKTIHTHPYTYIQKHPHTSIQKHPHACTHTHTLKFFQCFISFISDRVRVELRQKKIIGSSPI